MAENTQTKRRRVAATTVTSATALLDAALALSFAKVEKDEFAGFQVGDCATTDLQHTDESHLDAILAIIVPDLNTWLDAPIQVGGSSRRTYLLHARR